MTDHESCLKEAAALLGKSQHLGALESQQALDRIVEKLEATVGADDPEEQARRANILLGISERYQTDASTLYAAAKPALLAIEAGKKSSNKGLTIKALLDRGRVFNLAHCAGDAFDSLCEALELASNEEVDPDILVALWSEVGSAWLLIDEPNDAHPCYERAAQIAEDSGRSTAWARAMQGVSSLESGSIDEANAELRQALDAMDEGVSPLTRVRLHALMSRVLLARGDVDGASKHVASARAVADADKSISTNVVAMAAEGLLWVFRENTVEGTARILTAQQRAHDVWPALPEPFWALKAAAAKTGQAQLHREVQLIRDNNARVAGRIRSDIEAGKRADRSQGMLESLERIGKNLTISAERSTSSLLAKLEQHAIVAEAKEDDSGAHTFRVGKLARETAEAMGMDSDFCQTIELAAALHDVGKYSVPETIILKRGRLEPYQRQAMQDHAKHGYELLEAQTKEHPSLKMGAEIARWHHEHFDGNGYPDEISGDEIPLSARITALAEVYDALTHKRPWRKAKSTKEALKLIASLRGYQFDPGITDVFLKRVEELLQTHGEHLDAYLGAQAAKSPFNKARREIMDRTRGL